MTLSETRSNRTRQKRTTSFGLHQFRFYSKLEKRVENKRKESEQQEAARKNTKQTRKEGKNLKGRGDYSSISCATFALNP